MIKYIDISKKPTKEQIEMLKAAQNLPIPDDSDIPELTDEELKRFKRVKDYKRTDEK